MQTLENFSGPFIPNFDGVPFAPCCGNVLPVVAEYCIAPGEPHIPVSARIFPSYIQGVDHFSATNVANLHRAAGAVYYREEFPVRTIRQVAYKVANVIRLGNPGKG